MFYFRTMKRMLLFLLLAISVDTFAQVNSKKDFISKKMLIIHSDRSYEAALQFAGNAVKELELLLDLRGLKPLKEGRLSYGKHTCMENFGSCPCYVPKGQYDDGAYMSIEYSDDYTGFEKGYYIVVAAMFEEENSEVRILRDKTRKIYKDAYIKTTDVYMGCIH